MSALDAEYRTRQQIALSLGWGNVPPLDILVRDIRARDAGSRVLTKRVEALEAALADVCNAVGNDSDKFAAALARARELLGVPF